MERTVSQAAHARWKEFWKPQGQGTNVDAFSLGNALPGTKITYSRSAGPDRSAGQRHRGGGWVVIFCHDHAVYLQKLMRSRTKRIGEGPPISACFIEPMLCLAVNKLPEGPAWQYELKLDGYRGIGIKSQGRARLFSRNGKDFTQRFAGTTQAFESLPDETIIDGEIVAVDGDGKPSFNLLQHFESAGQTIMFYAFDLLMLDGGDIRRRPLVERRELLGELIKALPEPIHLSQAFDFPVKDLLSAVRENGLEGIVAKRRDSIYRSGDRSGDWVKMRANRGQEFVIGGYVPSTTNFDSILVGHYDGKHLIYAARIHAGFVPAVRQTVFAQFKRLTILGCPFYNLPDRTRGRWGEGLTAEVMDRCLWLKPSLVAQIEFLEWTPENRLRHPKFVGLRDDKIAKEVTRS